MKIAVRLAQWIVGVLFILSGLVKANDPRGLGYKMQEFFELWTGALGAGFGWLAGIFAFFHEQALVLSVVMIALEIVLGVALLLGGWKRPVLGALLVLMVFFTFLTGYAWGSGKFTNCGCFGDCLPITPLTSFFKDLVLLGLIAFLWFAQRHLPAVGTLRSRALILVGSLIAVMGLQRYVLRHLPLVDCLPFKAGNNLPQQMKPPAGSVPDSVAIRFIYEKNGKRYEFAPESLPADFTTYTYVDRVDKVVRKGNAIAPIKGFTLVGMSGTDSTQQVLAQPRALLVFLLRLEGGERLAPLRALVAANPGLSVYVAGPASAARVQAFLQQQGLFSLPAFSCDNTVIKTAARTHPTYYLLEGGTVAEKWSRANPPVGALK